MGTYHRTLTYGFCLLLGAAVEAQFTDGFADGGFATDPPWTGDTDHFTVGTDGLLRLQSSGAGAAYLVAEHGLTESDPMEWRFHFRQDFAGSNSNYGKVYLASDVADLRGPLNGYFLRFGEAGSADAVELYAQTGSALERVCRGGDGSIAQAFAIGVLVTRSATGEWSLAIDPAGGTAYGPATDGVHAAHGIGTHLGLVCTYTASNADRTRFGRLRVGAPWRDTEPPMPVQATAVGPRTVELIFDEDLAGASAVVLEHYSLEPTVPVSEVIWSPSMADRVRINLGGSLIVREPYTLSVAGVADPAGNVQTGAQLPLVYDVPDLPLPGDVVINELMVDPDPVVGLPESEYIELYNATNDKHFDLAGWLLSTTAREAVLPAYRLPPGGYVLLVPQNNISLFTGMLGVLPITWPTNALVNSGTTVTLQASGRLLDALTYSSSWYGDPEKADGGWSLERIDPYLPCAGAEPWTASVDPAGGTPAARNSTYAPVPDTVAPALVAVRVEDPSILLLQCDGPLDAASIATAFYRCEPQGTVSAAVAVPDDPAAVRLFLDRPLEPALPYTLLVHGLADCSGNTDTLRWEAFVLPEPCLPGDLVINELLYDPVGSGSDMVELYNRSAKYLDLGGLLLANASVARPLPLFPRPMPPGAYLAFATDTADITQRYPNTVGNALRAMALPAYPNGRGTVRLLAADGSELERFDYSDDLHFRLLANKEGVSLERIAADRSADAPDNWHSASSAVGGATPGYRNSQYARAGGSDALLTVEPGILSPDNDGYQDVLPIGYQLPDPGFLLSVIVHDLAGRPIRTLLNNVLAGTAGVTVWDGMADDGSKAAIGPYVVVLEAHALDGRTVQARRTVVVAHVLH